MSVQSTTETLTTESVIDDVFENQSSVDTENQLQLDQDKLAMLKNKLKLKQESKEPEMMKIVEKRNRSINFGVVGSGQCGSRIAEKFYELGYAAIAINTATTDLENIKVPDANKLLLSYGLGGAAKDLNIGNEAAVLHKDSINELVNLRLSNTQVLVLALSCGGGSGAGSLSVMIDILSATGKPIIVICVLPMSAEDSLTKKNALETLSKLSQEAQAKRVHAIICVDNSKLETIYKDVSQIDFYDVSNATIVEPLDTFNTYSSMSSPTKAIDSMEFAKLLTDGGAFSTYGHMNVSNYQESFALAEAVVNNLDGGLLANGFDLKQSKYVGVLFVANKSVWDQIPSSSVNYAISLIDEVCGTPDGKFHGIYVDDNMKEDIVKVYSFFSGLGHPISRTEQMRKEVIALDAKTKDKNVERNLNLKLDTGSETTVSTADKVRQEIARKKSAFGSLLNNSVQDLRKK